MELNLYLKVITDLILIKLGKRFHVKTLKAEKLFCCFSGVHF